MSDNNVIPFRRRADPVIPEPPPTLIGPAEAWMLFGVGVFTGIALAMMLGRLA